jgi:hypothetical protein
LQIARACDGAVLCALRDRSHVSSITKARERIDAAGVRLLAAVLNGAPSARSSSSYYRNRGLNPTPRDVTSTSRSEIS